MTPSNLTSPLPLRVALAAGDAVAVVAVVWLAAETIAAIAVRREVLAGGGTWRSVLGAAMEIVHRPISTLLTVVVSYATSAVAIGLALVGTSIAFDWCRIAARNQEPIAVKLGIGSFSTDRDFRPVVFALAIAALVVVWVAALAVSRGNFGLAERGLHQRGRRYPAGNVFASRRRLPSGAGWDYRARRERDRVIDPTLKRAGTSPVRGDPASGMERRPAWSSPRSATAAQRR